MYVQNVHVLQWVWRLDSFLMLYVVVRPTIGGARGERKTGVGEFYILK